MVVMMFPIDPLDGLEVASVQPKDLYNVSSPLEVRS